MFSIKISPHWLASLVTLQTGIHSFWRGRKLFSMSACPAETSVIPPSHRPQSLSSLVTISHPATVSAPYCLGLSSPIQPSQCFPERKLDLVLSSKPDPPLPRLLHLSKEPQPEIERLPLPIPAPWCCRTLTNSIH